MSLLATLGAIEKGSNFSTKHVIEFNTQMYFGYMGLGVLLLVGLYIAGFGDLLSILGRWLLLMIRKIVRALVKVEPTPETMKRRSRSSRISAW